MVVYGVAELPRVVVVGFGRTHPFASAVERYAGTVRYLEEDSLIRWDSWDAIVSIGDPKAHDSHLRVLQIGDEPTGLRRQGQFSLERALYLSEHVGDELVMPDDLDEDLRELVKRELIPVIDPIAHRRRIAPYRLASGGRNDAYMPLLHDLDGYAYAALYRPDQGLHECLYLPEVITNIAPWLLWVFKHWAVELPNVFPSQPEWTFDPIWMTAQELSAQSEATRLRADADRIIAEAEAAVDDAQAALLKVRESVDTSERLLLTGTDTPLVQVVLETLELFGFDVTDVDALLADGQHKKEDLRVERDDEWIALCEVKGYTKGAKLADLRKLDDYATLYAVEAGKPPNGKWYVVNQWRDANPDSRPQLLAGADEYLESFGMEGGLAIDTRDLFLMRKAVEAGSVSKETIRGMLSGSSGRFELPQGFGQTPPA